jgi:hypothetical protein
MDPKYDSRITWKPGQPVPERVNRPTWRKFLRLRAIPFTRHVHSSDGPFGHGIFTAGKRYTTSRKHSRWPRGSSGHPTRRAGADDGGY